MLSVLMRASSFAHGYSLDLIGNIPEVASFHHSLCVHRIRHEARA
jgi:hypothetical protein